jgi:hypothetical protein
MFLIYCQTELFNATDVIFWEKPPFHEEKAEWRGFWQNEKKKGRNHKLLS